MRAEIISSIATYLGKLDPPPEVDLDIENLGAVTLEELALDSLKSLELFMFLEESLSGESPLDHHSNDSTLNEIASHFESLLQP